MTGQLAAICNHCNGPEHKSKDELCLQCNRTLNECTFKHDMEKKLSLEDIFNAPDSEALIEIFFIIKDMYKSTHNRVLPSHAIFSKAKEIIENNNIKLPDAFFAKIKKDINTRESYQTFSRSSQRNIVDECFEEQMIEMTTSSNLAENNSKLFFQNFDASSDYILARSQSLEDDIPYPAQLKYGTVLVFCGAAVIFLSEGALIEYGGYITTLGVSFIASGIAQYDDKVAEQKRLKAEKIEKEQRKREEKAAKEQRKIEEKAAKAQRKLEKQRNN